MKLAAFLGAGLLVASASSAIDLPEVLATGELRVLVVDGSPAFFSLKPGTEPGLDREILEGFARLHKLTLRPVPAASWDALVPALVEGRGDVIAGGVTVTAARSRLVAWSAEVFPTRNVVVTRKPTPTVTTVEQLRTLKVGTIRGSSMAEAIAAAGVPAANVDAGIESGGAPEALRKGRIAATVSGIEDAFLYRRDDPEMQIGLFVGPAGSLAFGVRKDSPRLKAALDEHVNNVRRTPTWSRLVLKYFGADAPELLKKARAE
jgi:ABC-type amino acid transport substrate-binding protein